jgi:hypothetical protein
VGEQAEAASKDIAKATSQIGEAAESAKNMKYVPHLLAGALGLGGIYLGYKIYRDWKEDKEKDETSRRRSERLAAGRASKRKRTPAIRLSKPGTYTIDYPENEAKIAADLRLPLGLLGGVAGGGLGALYGDNKLKRALQGAIVGGSLGQGVGRGKLWAEGDYGDTASGVSTAAESGLLGLAGAGGIEALWPDKDEKEEKEAHCGVCPEDLAKGVVEGTRGSIGQADLEAVMKSEIDDEAMKEAEGQSTAGPSTRPIVASEMVSGSGDNVDAGPVTGSDVLSNVEQFAKRAGTGGAGGGIGTGVVGGDRLMHGTTDTGMSEGQQDGNVRTEDPLEHDMTENDIWGMSGAGGGERIASDVSPLAQGFLDNCEEAGLTYEQVKTAIDNMANTFDEPTVRELRDGLEKQGLGKLLSGLGKAWTGTGKVLGTGLRPAGAAAGYLNPEISEGLGAESFAGGDRPGFFSARRLAGLVGGGAAHKFLPRLRPGYKPGVPGTPAVPARPEVPAAGWFKGSPARPAQPAVPGVPGSPGWGIGRNIVEGGGGGITGTFVGSGLDTLAGQFGWDTDNMFARGLGLAGGLRGFRGLRNLASRGHLATRRAGQFGSKGPLLPRVAAGAQDMLTAGGGRGKGTLAALGTVGMLGGQVKGLGGAAWDAGHRAVRYTQAKLGIEKALDDPKTASMFQGLDKYIGAFKSWSSFTKGFNSFVDPIFKYMGMDPTKMGTMQKMLTAFGVLTALGGGAAGLLGSKTGGVIGILGALLAAGGVFGLGGKTGPLGSESLSSLFGGQTGAEGAGDVAGAKPSAATTEPTTPPASAKSVKQDEPPASAVPVKKPGAKVEERATGMQEKAQVGLDTGKQPEVEAAPTSQEVRVNPESEHPEGTGVGLTGTVTQSDEQKAKVQAALEEVKRQRAARDEAKAREMQERLNEPNRQRQYNVAPRSAAEAGF